MARAIYLILLYLLIVLSPLLLVLSSGPETSHGPVYEAGKAFALAGFAILAMQFLLSSRAKWMDRPFGLPLVLRFHRGMAILGGTLLVMHPFLLAGDGAGAGLLISGAVPWHIWLARAALAAVLLQVALSVFRKGLRLKFERWRLAHNILAVSILVAAFTHGIVSSGHDLRLEPMRILWFTLLFLALAFYVRRRFLVPFALRRQPWRVVDSHRETRSIWTLTFVPPEGQPRFGFFPGQFQFITLHRNRGLPEEEHHFTIASGPEIEGSVSSSIQERGDYTARIGETRIGDTASIEAPFGRFSYLLHPEDRDIVFIAGDIGITPVISMLRHMRDTMYPHHVILIYASHSVRDIAFRGELAKMEASAIPNFRVVHVLADPDPDWRGERGMVDPALLSRYVDERDSRAFYVSGLPSLVDAVYRHLRRMGVPAGNIRSEVFDFF